MRTSEDPAERGGAQPDPRREAALQALDRIKDPVSGLGLADAGLVRGLVFRSERAGFMLEVEAKLVERYAPIRDQAEAALAGLPGVKVAQVVLTTTDPAPPGGARSFAIAPSKPPATGSGSGPALTPPRPAAPEGVGARGPSASPAPARGSGPGEGPGQEAREGAKHAGGPALGRPDHVRAVIAVASGKGGVGKSTVAVNLACAFARLGLRTGLLDADVYGPSVPRLLGLSGEPKVGPDKRLQPFEAFGVKTASIGFLVPEGSPMIWRGPMASSAVSQLLFEVAWGEADEPLDLLLIDMPPGTGDVQLTLAQKIRLDGALIVSTPQEIALIDVRRGAAMFQKTAAPLLGVIENMAYFEDPAGGAPIEIFGRGGARKVAEELGAPFLGEIPIDIALRRGSDEGRPVSACAPETAIAARFQAIAEALSPRIQGAAGSRPPPRILTED